MIFEFCLREKQRNKQTNKQGFVRTKVSGKCCILPTQFEKCERLSMRSWNSNIADWIYPTPRLVTADSIAATVKVKSPSSKPNKLLVVWKGLHLRWEQNLVILWSIRMLYSILCHRLNKEPLLDFFREVFRICTDVLWVKFFILHQLSEPLLWSLMQQNMSIITCPGRIPKILKMMSKLENTYRLERACFVNFFDYFVYLASVYKCYWW